MYNPNLYNFCERTVVIAGGVANNAPLWELTPSNGLAPAAVFVALTKLSVQVTTAVATTIALEFPTAAGTSSTKVSGVVVSTGNGGTGLVKGEVVTAWSAAPTSITTLLHEALLLAQGNSIVWTWPQDSALVVPATGVALFNVTGGVSGGLIVEATWKEYYAFS